MQPDHNPNSTIHNVCRRLRELGYEGEGCPSVADVVRIAALNRLTAEGVRRLMAS